MAASHPDSTRRYAVAALACCLGAAAVAATPPSLPLPRPTNDPIDLVAASSDVDYRNNKLRFVKVRITQGPMSIEADEATCRRYAESSPSLVTALVPLIGYEAAAAAAHRAVDEHRTIREVVLESGLATEQQLDEALDVRAMTRGGLRARHG